MRHLRPAILLLGFAAFTLPLMPVQQVLLWLSPRAAARLPHWYHRRVARLLGISLRVRGEPPAKGPAFIVSNHVSWLDIIVLSAAAPVSFVAKKEVAKWPFFGLLAKLQRTVFVDRDRRHTTGLERDEISDRLKEGGMIVLFPEGTSHTGRSVLPFRSSYFAAVHDPGIPVIPVTLAYTERWGLPLTTREVPRYAWYGDMDLPPHLWNAVAEGPLTVDVIFHPPETMAHARDRKRLAAHAERTIRHGLADALHGGRKTG